MDTSKPKFPRRWRRRLLKGAVILVVAVIGFAIAAPSLVGWIIGHELKSQLASRMNATLDFARVIYKFPYGVRVKNAHLLLPGNPGGVDSWVDIGMLDLTLAKLPLGAGPLVIEKLAIENPMVHLTSSFGSSSTPSAPSSAPTQKLSDLFQLQNVAIIEGRFEYDFSGPGHPVPPVAWGHLNINMNTLPTSGGTYKFAVAISDQPVAEAKVTGSFDIDSLQLNADTINLAISCDPALHAEQIPPQGLALIQKYQMAGQVTVNGTASVSLNSLTDATFTANVDLKNARCQPPGFAGPITPTLCTITTTKQSGSCQFDLTMEDQDLASITAGGSVDLKTLLLDLQKFSVTVQCDPNKPTTQLPQAVADSLAKLKPGGQLTLDGIARVPLLSPVQGWYVARAALNDGRCQPPGWNGPVTPAKFSVTASNVPGATADSLPTVLPESIPGIPAESHMWLSGLSAACGDQIFKISGGELAFNPTDKSWTARKFLGTLDIGDGPGPLDGTNTRIILPFVIAGDSVAGLRAALDDGSAVITQNHLHLNRVNGMLTVNQTGMQSSNLTAKCAEGEVKAVVNLDWHTRTDGPPISLSYDGEVHVNQLDLHQLAIQYTTDPAIRQHALGYLDWNLKYDGSILQNGPSTGIDSVVDRFNAQGDFDITHGYFLDIPILRDVLGAMHNPNGSTVGEAAATFEIGHSVVNFTRAGASSPALGIQGSGTLGFDQQVNMIFVATPLADWAKDAKGSGLLSDAGAALLGKAQDVVNGLQRAIYQFRLTGDISNPKIERVVIPFLSDKMGPLFQKMAGDQTQGNMAEELKKEQADK